jgi:hypothetical protein
VSRVTPTVIPARKLAGRLSAVLVADGDHFVTRALDRLALDLDGIPGDRHRGPNRPADARVPWYPRGTPIRNERQVSVVAPDDLAKIAAGLGIPAVEAAWLGANLVVEGIPDLSFLPRGTRLVFPSGAALAVADQNAPCRNPGRVIASHHPDRPGLDLAFPKVAKRLRGVVTWVERAGEVVAGDAVEARLPEQWVYGDG